MKRLLFILSFFVLLSATYSLQNRIIIEGKISYLSSQNIYVKFTSTAGIAVGDTLFAKMDNQLEPAVLVKYLSSKSCSGVKLLSTKFEIGTTIFAFIEKVETIEPADLIVVEKVNKTVPEKKSKKRKNKKDGKITGRLSLSSYGNISSMSNADYVRWRYTFAARSQNFQSSNFSFDSYISFNYRSTEWSYIKNNISDALKIYSLSIDYKFNENLNLTFGRKINRNISNIGAVDGVQLEGKFNNFTAGLIVGSRPDYLNYTLNFSLFEFGGFINHSLLFNSGTMKNSLALFQQTNDFKIDRRFLYFQHSSSFIKKIHLFLSSEIDLYKRTNDIPESTFSLTGLYLSLRYQPIRAISFQTSYDSRKNVIYYETFQNYTDSLYENATRQGLRFRVNIRPINRLFINLSYGYRFRTGDLRTSENYSGNISYSNLPFISGTFGVSYNHLSTSYLNGEIFSVRYSRDILSGIVFGNIDARYINYLFLNSAPDLEQLIFGADISWRILRKLSLSLNYEGTFEQEFSYGRVYFNITKRF
ncbi:MAG: hypothetical protein L3J41_05730 [Melioribacteraceae bacterium]|nr:hypothetical protein [Melioribacteraceae bacterium]